MVKNMLTDRLLSECKLKQKKYIVSRNKEYYLTMQEDGNLVIYNSREFVASNAVWASGTNGQGEAPFTFRVQDDGNAVVYDKENNPTWATGTHGQGQGPYCVVVSNEGKLCVYDTNDEQLWSS